MTGVRQAVVSGVMLLAIVAVTQTPVSTAPKPRMVRLGIDLPSDPPARQGQARRHLRVPMIQDPSQRQVIFPEVVQSDRAEAILNDARFQHQYLRRHRKDFETPPDVAPPADGIVRDWSFSLGGGNGGTIAAPAKYVFDVTAAPSCTNDFVVTSINIAGSGTQANIIAFNSLYNMPSGLGLCAGTAPLVMFAYNVGTGTINSYPALSLDGKKVAFTESGTAAIFHVLTWKTGAGNGTSATAPATPGAGNTAVDVKLTMTGTSSTAPFVDYANDVVYVTTSNGANGIVHKITGVFNGTPTEVAGSGWPFTIAAGLSTPVFDGVTRRVFFTDSTGKARYIDDPLAGTATLSATTFQFAATTGVTAAPLLVDSGNQRVYAFAWNPNGANAVVGQADTSLSAGSQVIGNLGSSTSNRSTLMGDVNEAYYNGVSASARLYVTGTDSSANRVPALFAMSFNASFKMNAAPSNGPVVLATNNTGISASPVTAFYNSTLGKQFIFVGITNRCSAAVTTGCIRSIDVTGGAFPTAVTVNNTIFAAAGGTGGISIDNNSAGVGAASVYYTTLSGATIVKATQAGLQ